MLTDRIHIYYATFSGTAEGFAQTLTKDLETAGIPCRLTNLKDFQESEMRTQDNLVFIVATHYEGNCPDDANDFFAWMTDASKDKSFFGGKKVTLFGLGDNTYDNFNQFGRDIEKFLLTNKAVFFFNSAFGSDHDNNIEADFTPWKNRLVNFIKSNFKMETKKPEQLKGARFTFYEEEAGLPTGEFQYALQYEKLKSTKSADVLSVTELRQVHSNTVRTYEVVFGLPKDETYVTADNLVLFTPNPAFRVIQALKYFKLSGDEKVFVNFAAFSGNEKIPFNSGSTVRYVLENVYDLHGPLKFLNKTFTTKENFGN